MLVGLVGLVLVLFAGQRTRSRSMLVWQVLAAALYVAVAALGLARGDDAPWWTWPALVGGAVGLLLGLALRAREELASRS